jgi:hypothetical protein
MTWSEKMDDLGPCVREVHDHWEVEVNDPLLALLLPAATRGLHEEDQKLANTFRRAPSSNRLFERNQGLGYWLFETTLVYIIFKSWLPLAEIEWEVRYPPECSPTHKSADLVIFANNIARYVFEAKWWMTNSMNVEILKDIARTRSWPHLEGRFILAFWRSRCQPATWVSDLSAVRQFCKEHQIRLIYVGAFRTDEAATRATCGSYFALSVISV